MCPLSVFGFVTGIRHVCSAAMLLVCAKQKKADQRSKKRKRGTRNIEAGICAEKGIELLTCARDKDEEEDERATGHGVEKVFIFARASTIIYCNIQKLLNITSNIIYKRNGNKNL